MRRLLPALLVAAGCAAEKPKPPVERAPPARRPELVGLFRMNQRPTLQTGTLETGTPAEARPCPGNPRVFGMAPPRGVLVRFQAPVPTDLRLSLVSPSGGQQVPVPEDVADEDRLYLRERPYAYENQALARSAPVGTVATRELFVSPGAMGKAGRFDLLLRTISYDPLALGADRESPPLTIPVVAACPDLAVELVANKVSLRPGSSVRWKVLVRPLGDSLGEMKVTLAPGKLPKGVTAEVREAELSGLDWTSIREARIDLTVAPDVAPGEVPVVVRARVGTVERSGSETLRVLAPNE